MKFECFRQRYSYCYLTIILFGGVLTSICKYVGISLPLSFLSLTLLLSFPIFFLTYFSVLIFSKVDIIFHIIGVVIFGILLKSIYFLKDADLNSFVNTIYYLSIFLSISLCYGLNKSFSLRMFRYIYISMSILAVIGLVQFFFHESLPNAFVELPVIKSELAITNNSREIEDIILFSMNGLYNNPIVYGSTLLFPLTISLFNIFNERKLSDMCIFFLSLISILLLVSRVNIASAVFLVLFICVLKLSFKNALYTSILFSVACVILFVILKDSPVVNLIIDRFTGNDEWASVSNEEHYSDYIKSLSYISDNMILGIKINDYVTKDIITDGSWFIFALDLSPVICIILIFMFLSIAYKFWLVSRENAIPNFAPLYFILTMGGLFNSFLIDKASLSIILIFYSLQYNIALKR